MKTPKPLVEVSDLNWQQCEEDHKLILHREKVCPLCEFKLEAQLHMQDCYKQIFNEWGIEK